MSRHTTITIALVAAVLLVLLWLSRDRLMPGASQPAPVTTSAPASSGGSTASLFTARVIGNAPRAEERPQIAHVAISDLDRDGLSDVLVCDSLRNIVSWIRQAPLGTFTETTIAGVAAPAHAEAIDFDKDGDLDVVVAALGFLFPNNNRVGSVIVLENDGQQKFKSHYIADRVARVADARAADLDGDGDLDVSVAGFGYDDGETSWLKNQGDWEFEQHVLQRLSGPINAIPTDINGDKKTDTAVWRTTDSNTGVWLLNLPGGQVTISWGVAAAVLEIEGVEVGQETHRHGDLPRSELRVNAQNSIRYVCREPQGHISVAAGCWVDIWVVVFSATTCL
jgi:hypothetical protein